MKARMGNIISVAFTRHAVWNALLHSYVTYPYSTGQILFKQSVKSSIWDPFVFKKKKRPLLKQPQRKRRWSTDYS